MYLLLASAAIMLGGRYPGIQGGEKQRGTTLNLFSMRRKMPSSLITF